MANWPTPPAPTTRPVAPATSPARLTTEPAPVMAAQPSSAASANETPGGMGRTPGRGMSTWVARAPTAVIRYTGSPSWRRRVVPSGSVPAANPARRFGHAASRPSAHTAQWRQPGAQQTTTRSPTARSSTSSPTASTTPEPSWPRTIGTGRVHSPRTTWRSEPQMPTAAMRTRTSPGPGASTSISSTRIGAPGASNSAARAEIPSLTGAAYASRLELDLAAGPALAGGAEDERGGGGVLHRDAHGLVERDVLGRRAPGTGPVHELPDLRPDVVGRDEPPLDRLQEVGGAGGRRGEHG